MEAEVERRAGEAEEVEAPPEIGETAAGDAGAAVRSEAPLDQVELVAELACEP